ncbi:unnamed protein product [Cylicocyclus nassatus]|uniref:Uncharacterized protein n=1 Tax=Cylicocyclus nassatus TaxID=53992 RepID=A0AA36DNA2_CYLNA|nr:unnamed protein product [Cylicocyclus nassatus]
MQVNIVAKNAPAVWKTAMLSLRMETIQQYLKFVADSFQDVPNVDLRTLLSINLCAFKLIFVCTDWPFIRRADRLRKC